MPSTAPRHSDSLVSAPHARTRHLLALLLACSLPALSLNAAAPASIPSASTTSPSASAELSPPAVPFNNVLYGVAYYHEYHQAERLEEDVRLMQEAGISVVRLAESSWSGFEPEEGRFEFDWMDRIIDRMHKAGIKVIVGTPTYSIPPWLWKKHPEILIEYPDGKKVGYGIRQNMDLTNASFLFYSERIIRKLAARYAAHPAVIGFQVDNETLTRGASNTSFQEGFNRRLKQKFGTVENLNKAWGLQYWGMSLADWSELPPVQNVTNTGYKLEWERYKASVVADFLTWQARIVGEYKRPGQFVTQCFMNVSETDLPASSRAMELLAINTYPPAQDDCTGLEHARAGDYLRSVKGRNYLVTETTGQTTGWDSRTQYPPYDGQLRLNAYACIGSGANLVAYWHWHSLPYGQETYWKGVLSHDLQPNRIYAEVKQTGAELKAIGPRLVNLRIKPSVAILLSYDSNHALNIMPYRDAKDPKEAYWRDVLPSVHKALYNNSVAADFIYPGRNQLKDYGLVIVPPLYVASDAELAEIDAYVKNGGHVVMLFKSGFCDENSTVRTQLAPGPLRAACGFHYQEFASLKSLPLASNPYGVDEKENTVADWADLLIPDTATPVAYYKHLFYGKWPAITRNQYGKGTLLYEGTRPSDALQEKILMDEITRAGLARPADQTHFPLITKCGLNDAGKNVRFLYNFSAAPLTFNYAGPGGTSLLDGKPLARGSSLTLPAWDLLLIEEPATP